MYPTTTRTRLGDSPYVRKVYELPSSLENRIPTFEKTLDVYFDAHFEEIISEWQLLTDHDLHDLESRLDTVTREITALYTQKSDLEKRAEALKKELEKLEGSP
ncbi:MAG: hypothetical protein HXS41_04515 [Theionarchaea archaeon]|nr:hypothetical protein [Theionarchaea archaeon]MBU6999536.1 hypothetical protein [Theionarchaea archaeon]MBU7020300.1 hypothetical protein [Theionarchaea archaeon]MBU7035155.1 hypothetical protein [Theionarchaea archaeon]MBU7041387.1 hypothetical protein [Theionarchaea archaeon]